MPQDGLGLFDTPPNRTEVRLSLAIVGALLVVEATLLTLPDTRLREIQAFIPMVDATMFIGELITAALLYVHASIFRSRALTVLASGYAFTALMLVAHVLTFPGAFAPTGLLGAGINTTGWIMNTWRGAVPIAVIAYVLLKRGEAAGAPGGERRRSSIALGICAAVALAAAAILLATWGHDLLPSMFLDRRELNYPNMLRVNVVLLALQLSAIVLLFRRRSSVLDLWLLVALAGWLAHTVLNVQSHARFTALFYGQSAVLMFSNLVVMIALMAESSRLYLRLALSTAARDRERDARLMTMDAMAAAVSHEVGQPLTAVSLNAMAGLQWLESTKPNLKEAAKSLGAVLDALARTTAVVKGLRGVTGRTPCTATDFNLNALVRETLGLLERELEGSRISLQLELDESLPPILADRVQIQRVLVNLFTNAIESLGTVRRRRRLVVRSAAVDGPDGPEVLLEVSDNGAGIAPADLPQIFEAFFTTKATGTGLGLSLCRTIVESHGGHLWATPGEPHGATFHLKLPCEALLRPATRSAPAMDPASA